MIGGNGPVAGTRLLSFLRVVRNVMFVSAKYCTDYAWLIRYTGRSAVAPVM